MKRKQKANPYQNLINMIHAATKLRGWNLADTAKTLGISHVYMTSITSGARTISGLSLDKQRALAMFLGISMVDFFLMAGILRPEDFVAGKPSRSAGNHELCLHDHAGHDRHGRALPENLKATFAQGVY